MSRHRSWCFTINNWTPSDLLSVQSLMKDSCYAIVGKEVGESGTPHLQGYVRLSNAKTMYAVKKYLPRAHLELAKGNDDDNRKYCSKDGDYEERGECGVGQGVRMDLREAAQVIQSRTVGLTEFMFSYPEIYMKYGRAIRDMFSATYLPRTTPPEVHWRWGLAGVGKTRYCVEKHSDHYPKDNSPWWDGYVQQEAIIIDDFDNTIPYRTLLRILDRYAYQGQVKGGYVHINSPYIYITCEHPPSYYWHGNELAQVQRRLTSVQEIKKDL